MNKQILESFDQSKAKCCFCNEYFDKDAYKTYKWNAELVSEYDIDVFYDRYHGHAIYLQGYVTREPRYKYCPSCFEKKYKQDLEVKAKNRLSKAPPWLTGSGGTLWKK